MSAEFVDTNVLLYAYDSSAGERHERARALVTRLAHSRQGAISVQVLQEFYVNAVHKIACPLAPDAAQDRLRAFSRWPVHSPLSGDVIAAAQLAERYQLSFWDALIAHSAQQMHCALLWSEDLNDGERINGVEVRNPFTH